MSIKLLKEQLKSGEFSNVYLFFGQEEYLKKHYLNEIKSKIIDKNFKDFNYYDFHGKSIETKYVQDAIESLPVMSEYKMIVINDSGLFKLSKEKQDKFWGECLKDLPTYACIIFYEKEVDKRNALFKNIKKQGVVLELDKQKTADLAKWVNNVVRSYKKDISREDIYFMLEMCDNNMINMKNEIDKLVNYLGEKNYITRNDIERICTPSVESKVFQMIDYIMQKNFEGVFRLLKDMKVLREPVVKISYLISANFSKTLKVKLLLASGIRGRDIASKASIPPFTVNKYARQAEGFTVQQLHNILQKCLEVDSMLKSSSVDGWIILEQFIMEFDNC